MAIAELLPFSHERVIEAVEKVHERLFRATAALDQAGIRYAVVGGNAIAEWVARADRAAVRNTQDVDVLLRREDLEQAKQALEGVGFFLDGPEANARDAVHIVFAGERVLEGNLLPHPDVADSVRAEHFQVLTLEALVQIKLTAFRFKDRVHLLDLIEVGLVDESWVSLYPPELGQRLQDLLDNPDS